MAVRLARQQALTDPNRQWVLIQTEGALDWCVRDPALMAEQISYVADVSQLPNVRIGLIRRRTPSTILAPHGFHIFDGRAVQISTKKATALIDDANDIATYEALFNGLESMAFFGEETYFELRRIADEYETWERRPRPLIP